MNNFSRIGTIPNNTIPYTNRRCGLFDGKKDNCDEIIAEEKHHNLSCYSCDEERCNAASFLMEQRWIIVVSVIAGLFLVKAL